MIRWYTPPYVYTNITCLWTTGYAGYVRASHQQQLCSSNRNSGTELSRTSICSSKSHYSPITVRYYNIITVPLNPIVVPLRSPNPKFRRTIPPLGVPDQHFSPFGLGVIGLSGMASDDHPWPLIPLNMINMDIMGIIHGIFTKKVT
jgi:hypothetical protein